MADNKPNLYFRCPYLLEHVVKVSSLYLKQLRSKSIKKKLKLKYVWFEDQKILRKHGFVKYLFRCTLLDN